MTFIIIYHKRQFGFFVTSFELNLGYDSRPDPAPANGNSEGAEPPVQIGAACQS
jgi:hypothetical protein